jgi:beta-lactamase regulating signal transducer with metallopeptidase domain
MGPLYHAVTLASAGAVSNLIGAIWEGAVLAAAVFLCLRLLPRMSAAARSLVWLNVFLLLVLLHVLPAFRASQMSVSAAHGWRIDLDPRWSLAIAGLWAALSSWKAAQLISGAVHLHKLARRATPRPCDAELGSLLKLGPRGRAVELCTSDDVARPSVFGFFRPRILLPPVLAERLSECELRQVVLHEMEHLRRADDWTNLLQKIALVLFPLNPALVWVERRLCAERELACDDRVLLSNGARKAYAICLTRLAEYSMLRRGFSLVLGAWDRRPELARRVHRLLARPSRGMGSWQARLVTASLIAGVLGGALALTRSPQFVGFAAKSNLPDRPNAGSNAGRNTGTMLQAGAAPVLPPREMNAGPIDSAPKLVQAKAVLPRRPARSSPATKLARNRMVARNAAQKREIDSQGWMVLTEWSGSAAPPRAVFALKLSPRGSYAAVPTMNGWLIVQI